MALPLGISVTCSCEERRFLEFVNCKVQFSINNISSARTNVVKPMFTVLYAPVLNHLALELA